MIITYFTIDNMFGINDVDIDLTYSRKTPSSPIKQHLQKYPKINFKKIAIILGTNASGKTSIGKSLGFAQYFLWGKNLDIEKHFFQYAQFDTKKHYGFEIEFITDDTIFRVEAKFQEKKLVKESWKKIEMTQNDSITTLRKKLDTVDFEFDYPMPLNSNEQVTDNLEAEGIIFNMQSAYLSMLKNQRDRALIDRNLNFFYRFSGSPLNRPGLDSSVDVKFFKHILSAFDPSIKNVRRSKDNKEELLIELINGHIERVNSKGELHPSSVLSAGTKEAISLVMILFNIKNNAFGTYYIDEQLAFSHSDLEQAILKLIIEWIDKKDVQVFFTTHNVEMLDVGLPSYNYIFTRKYNHNKSIEVIEPEHEIIHKDRSLKNIVKDDVFSISPSIDELMEVID